MNRYFWVVDPGRTAAVGRPNYFSRYTTAGDAPDLYGPAPVLTPNLLSPAGSVDHRTSVLYENRLLFPATRIHHLLKYLRMARVVMLSIRMLSGERPGLSDIVSASVSFPHMVYLLNIF